MRFLHAVPLFVVVGCAADVVDEGAQFEKQVPADRNFPRCSFHDINHTYTYTIVVPPVRRSTAESAGWVRFWTTDAEVEVRWVGTKPGRTTVKLNQFSSQPMENRRECLQKDNVAACGSRPKREFDEFRGGQSTHHVRDTSGIFYFDDPSLKIPWTRDYNFYRGSFDGEADDGTPQQMLLGLEVEALPYHHYFMRISHFSSSTGPRGPHGLHLIRVEGTCIY